MLIDVHVHFLHAASPRADWRERNASRFRAAARIGITWQVSSILGTWGGRSPTYFPSPADLTLANEIQRAIAAEHPTAVRGYVAVNPNFTEHALHEIEQGLRAGMIGIKLAASRRADDALLEPICHEAARRGVPVLHHVWHHRRRDYPAQEASDGVELCRLARRHPAVPFILAHIGGGGDWEHSLREVRRVPNVFVDLSGSGVDGGMLDACVDAVGADRLVWGTDLTMGTGLAKLRYLERTLATAQVEAVRWRNAAGIFPPGSFPET